MLPDNPDRLSVRHIWENSERTGPRRQQRMWLSETSSRQSEQRSTNIRGTKVLGTVQIIMVNNRSCYQVKVKSDFPPFTFVHILLWKFTREWVQFLWKTFRDLKVGPYAPTKILILQCKQASKISAHIPTSQPDGGLEASGHDLHSVSKVFPTRFLELPGSLNVLPSS